MKTSRKMEASGLVVNHFGGTHNFDDAMSSLRELLALHENRSDVYEIVVHADDIRMDFEDAQIVALHESMRESFRSSERGALAFVSNGDLMFGLCRQLEMTMDNEKIAISVFRSEKLAREWVDEIRSLHDGA